MAASIILAVVFPFCIACSDDGSTERIVRAGEGGLIAAEGGKVYMDVEAEGKWRVILPDDAAKWCTADPAEGKDAGRVEISLALNEGAERSVLVKVTGDRWFDTLRIVQAKSLEDFTNVVRGRLEIPRLTGETEYQFINHTVNYQGKEVNNYCMEYHLAKRHSRWVAFTAYDVTAADHITRTDAWADDPALAPEYHTTKADYSGYDRGHLVASNDRRYCREANEQTFYYSNMSPQLADFNQKIWQKLEENVKSWMQDAALRDTLYVVKGGTIRDDQVIKYNGDSQVAVPKYYFMAVLARKGEQYQSIAFWLEHKSYPTPYDLPGKAISVDELEENTGIDFFPLLPDAIENKVEATFDVANWTWK